MYRYMFKDVSCSIGIQAFSIRIGSQAQIDGVCHYNRRARLHQCMNLCKTLQSKSRELKRGKMHNRMSVLVRFDGDKEGKKIEIARKLQITGIRKTEKRQWVCNL